MTTHELVQEFAMSVSRQSAAIEIGDSRTGNKFAKRYIAAFEKIREKGDEGRDALAALLTDERAEVRVVAAAYLLRYREAQATAVLAAEAQGSGTTAFRAEQALQRWNEGTWSLDPA